ncbi:MAG: TonB C-terminal domain-containing protein [Syntrophaceae bacterium]|nr:TonB C-terminal domain-containing protein [Syntrophaceae bacterium]
MTSAGLFRPHQHGGSSLNRMILFSGFLHVLVLVLLVSLGPISSPTRLTFGPVYSVSLVSMADTVLKSPGPDLTREVLGVAKPDHSTVLRKEPVALSRKTAKPAKQQAVLDRRIEELRRKVEQTERSTSPSKPAMTARFSSSSSQMSEADLNNRMGVYYAVLWNRIRNQWALPADLTKGQTLEAIVQARILRSGEITGLDFEKRSGNRYFDDSALKAVQKASPFPPLPEWIPDRVVEVGIRFHSSQLKR